MEAVVTEQPRVRKSAPKQTPHLQAIPEGYMSLEQFEQDLKEAIRKKI